MDDLHEVRVVADEQHALVGSRGRGERERVVDVEVARQRVVDDELAAELLAGQPRGVQRAHARARRDELKRDPERGQRAPRRARLLLAALGQAPLGVGPGVVWLGLAMAQKPELLSHAAQSTELALEHGAG